MGIDRFGDFSFDALGSAVHAGIAVDGEQHDVALWKNGNYFVDRERVAQIGDSDERILAALLIGNTDYPVTPMELARNVPAYQPEVARVKDRGQLVQQCLHELADGEYPVLSDALAILDGDLTEYAVLVSDTARPYCAAERLRTYGELHASPTHVRMADELMNYFPSTDATREDTLECADEGIEEIDYTDIQRGEPIWEDPARYFPTSLAVAVLFSGPDVVVTDRKLKEFISNEEWSGAKTGLIITGSHQQLDQLVGGGYLTVETGGAGSRRYVRYRRTAKPNSFTPKQT